MTDMAASPPALDVAGAFEAGRTPGTVPRFLESPAVFIWHYLRTRPWLFASLFGVAFLAAACSVVTQYGMKLLVDAISGATPDAAAAWTWLGVFIALIACESVLWRCSGWLGAKTTISIGVDIRLDLLDYMIGHPVGYFQDNLAGSLGHRLTSTAGAFGILINRMVWDISPPIIALFGAVIVFATFAPWMAATLGLFATGVTVGLILFGFNGRKLHRAYAEQSGRVGGELVDVISNVWAIKAFSARERERRRLSESFSREALAHRSSWMFTEKSRVLHDIMLLVMAGGMLVWSMALWQKGSITAGDVVVVSTLTFRILYGSRDFAMAMVDMTQHLAYLGESLRLIGKPHEIVDAPEAAPIVPRRGEVEFRNVTFGYGDGRRVLKHFSLRIAPGQKVGIVGPSGAGKSTIVHLMQRLHDVQDGTLLIDGHPVGRLKQDSLREAISVVPQDVSLFHRTILDNIRFARPDATQEEIVAASRAAFCDDFIRALPNGYDTLVGERGAKLSGGQRQRLGIARAFLKNTPIIILDEATSGLDTQSELEVQEALSNLMRDRTVIAVAHRLSTIASFDRILVVMDGAIVEDGAPKDLRRADGIFARMWSLQAEGLSVDDIAESELEPSRPEDYHGRAFGIGGAGG